MKTENLKTQVITMVWRKSKERKNLWTKSKREIRQLDKKENVSTELMEQIASPHLPLLPTPVWKTTRVLKLR